MALLLGIRLPTVFPSSKLGTCNEVLGFKNYQKFPSHLLSHTDLAKKKLNKFIGSHLLTSIHYL